MTGARAFCAMKHVGLNVASDCLMTMTITGAYGGLVIAVADDVGMSSSQNEQDSRFWGRFAHMPVLEPADSQEAYEMTKQAFVLSERFEVPGAAAPDHAHLPRQGPGHRRRARAHEPAGFVKNRSAG
jgi:indolepyruvate ferredoxin oxidoreductase alpha subunit